MDFTLPSHPPLFDKFARKGMCTGIIAVKHSEKNIHARVCHICDEVR